MILLYLLLGLVQGILEWLPVSSEGQIVFLAVLNGWGTSDALTLAFWLHLGTMFAVIVVYWEEWKRVLQLIKPDDDGMRQFLIITTIGTAITGIPVKIFLEDVEYVLQAGVVLMWII